MNAPVGQVRSINGDLYWPLADLDQLSTVKPFVSSLSTTIYDDLANQTFTVINKLHLSQYNDLIGDSSLAQVDRANRAYNLYACLVDADVRHHYATLGVYFKRAPNEIPIELSKRLRATQTMLGGQSSMANNAHELESSPVSNPDGRKFTRAISAANFYSSLRDNQLFCKLS